MFWIWFISSLLDYQTALKAEYPVGIVSICGGFLQKPCVCVNTIVSRGWDKDNCNSTAQWALLEFNPKGGTKE